MREALGSHLELLLTLLTADIEYLKVSHAQNSLEQEGGFADARLTAQQHEGAFHQSAAQHTVELGIVGVEAHLCGALHLAEEMGSGSPFSSSHP